VATTTVFGVWVMRLSSELLSDTTNSERKSAQGIVTLGASMSGVDLTI
jgi:hypothetical protein